MNVVERMAQLAMIAHNGVNRDGPGNVPYIVHPHAVVCLLKHWGYAEADDPVTLAVAWGHDVLEDTDTPESEILLVSRELGSRVLDGIRLLTFRPGMPSGHPDYGRLKAEYIKNVAETAPVEILPVKIADRLCNTLDFKHNGRLERAQEYYANGHLLFERIDELKHASMIRQDVLDVGRFLQPPPWVTTEEDIRSTTVCRRGSQIL